MPAGLVLVLLAVELQVHQGLHITRASTAPALIAESHLDLSKSGVRPLQVLQCLLLRSQRCLPTPRTQLLCRVIQRLNGLVHFFSVLLEARVGGRQLASLHTLRQRLGLIAQLALCKGQQLGVFRFCPFIR